MRFATVISLAIPALALAQPVVVERITATSDARAILRVDDRTLVATEGGLVVLSADGSVERVLGARDGLPGDRLRSLSATRQGVWAGGVEGLALLDAELRVVRTLPLRRVRRVVDFGDATLAVSFGDGLHRLGGSAEPIRLGTAGAYDRLSDALVQGGELWVGTSGAGLVRLGPDLRVRGRVRRADGLADDYVWALARDGENVVVLGLAGPTEIRPDGTVDRRGALALAARRLPVRDVRAFKREGSTILLGTWGAGLYRVDGARAMRVAPSIQNVHAISAGLVAHDGGLHRAGGEAILAGGLPSGDVTAIAQGLGALWVGTFGQGLVRIAGGRAVPQREAHERWGLDRRINHLAVAHSKLWIATDRGLWYLEGGERVMVSRVDDPRGPGLGHVTSLHVDREGALWVASSRLLSRLRAGRWQSWAGGEGLPVAQLHAVTTDAQGRVWVGSLHGLFRFEPATGRFERHGVSSGALPVDWVTALVPWNEGVLAGTYHGGLAIGDGRRFEVVSERAGLPSGWVNPHAIAVRGRDAWIGTLERGLVVGRPGAWRRLGTGDGLPSDDVTDILVQGPDTWVATRGGLARLR
ncbi:MAG: hypothetical protein IT378_26250 [Sandaracinaceae bacterium]|nr:hypothetical protein [Sandaracinaceae bacterium]